jgi:phosphate:Na+ symporter
MVNDLEKVGDHCENLWELAQRKMEERVNFSQMAMEEFDDLAGKTRDFLAFVYSAMERKDVTIGEKAQFMENQIDDLEERLRLNHISRLNTGECSVTPGLIFIDMLHNFEKIGDHTHSVSRALIGKK